MIVAVALGLTVIGRDGWSIVTWSLVGVGVAVVGAGLVLGRGAGSVRRRAWELQAIGAAMAATGWVSGIGPGT